MAANSPETAGPKSTVGWENAAAAAGAVFAGWAAGRGKGLGVVAGLAAAAGVSALANRRREAATSMAVTVPTTAPVAKELSKPDAGSMRELFDAPPEDNAAEHWQKMAMSLMEVVHAMATRANTEPPAKPAPPTFDYAMGPLIWEPRATPESRSDGWGNSVWFGMQDLMPALPKKIETPLEPIMETASAGVCEVILPPESVAPPVVREEPSLPQVLVTAEIPAVMEAILTPAPLELAHEKAAQAALMQALQAEPEPMPVSSAAFVKEPPPREEAATADAHPALAVDGFPTIAEEAPIEEFVHESTYVDVESLLKVEPEAEPEVEEPSSPQVNTTLPPRRETLVVQPREESVFARLVARQSIDLNLPEPRPEGVSPMAFAPHIIPADADGALKPAAGGYSGSKLVPVAPNAEKKPRSMWPRILVFLALFVVGLLVTVQRMTNGTFFKVAPLRQLLQGREPQVQVPAKANPIPVPGGMAAKVRS